MAYDTYMNRETGDWVFSANGDFMGATGEEFDRQRIWIRAKIPRGTFTYDLSKTLGSTLYQISRNPSRNQLETARSALYTALEGITGISIDDISAVQDGNQIQLMVTFSKKDDGEETAVIFFDLATGQPEGTEFPTSEGGVI